MDSSNQNGWNLKHTDAQLDVGQLTAKVNIDQPELGIAVQSAFGRKLPACQILGFAHQPAVSLQATDQYIRGEDLVVTYESAVDSGSDSKIDPQLTDQVYWSSFCPAELDDCFGFELVCSLQTDRLDLQPRFSLTSRLAALHVSVVRELGGQIVIERVKGDVDIDPTGSVGILTSDSSTNVSYLQALHFTDQESCDGLNLQVSDHEVSIAVTLLVPHLEKGVIRRARVRGSFFDGSQVSNDTIGKWFAAFSQSSLPLTV